jgi:hypothetical protein
MIKINELNRFERVTLYPVSILSLLFHLAIWFGKPTIVTGALFAPEAIALIILWIISLIPAFTSKLVFRIALYTCMSYLFLRLTVVILTSGFF